MIARPALVPARRPIAVWLFALAACLVSGSAAPAEDDFLPAAQVFEYVAQADAQAIVVSYNVRTGYYLYRQRMGFATTTSGVTLGAAEFPKGLPHKDDYFGEQEIYRGGFAVRVPYTRGAGAPAAIDLTLKLQGCADKGLCYPPQSWPVHVTLPAAPPTGAGLLGKLTGHPADSGSDFLPVEQAFAVTADAPGANAVRLHFVIADGYYLYKGRISVSGTSAIAQLGAPDLPKGLPHTDDYFGAQEIYRQQFDATVPYARATGAAGALALKVGYQGCADKGLCYPPQTKVFDLALPVASAADAASGAGASAAPLVSEQDRLRAVIVSGSLWVMVATFFASGLLLALTPCVLPMVPILSGIIAGDGERVTPLRGFSLALAYVLGMAITYTIAGAVAALAGKQAQAFFQQPWILVLFAGLFVVLAAAMFGLFELQMPSALQTRFASASNQIKGGKFLSTALMGALSSLVVTACVAPPLVAVLVFIGQSGDVVRGALALFSMAIGMGVPLLIVGASAGKLLPKAGPWMETVKAVFGVVFLGVAAWMLDRLLPARLEMLLWAGVAFAGVWVLLRVGLRGGRRTMTRWATGGGVAVYGVVLVVSAALGGTNPLRPLAGTGMFGASKAIEPLPFQPIRSSADLDGQLAAAGKAGKPVLLDFYADWCVSCKEMEAHTYSEPAVRAALAQYVILKADVTANDADDQALLKRFGIIGPPTTAFFGADGKERANFRLVGFVAGDAFLTHLKQFESAP
jgi:thiol:disulfide interchange protein DsbD